MGRVRNGRFVYLDLDLSVSLLLSLSPSLPTHPQTLPHTQLDGFDPAFTITKASTTKTALPSAHTCFNQLVLPEYGAQAVLQERLHVAVEEGGGFHMT